jgi:hypothetical protein
VQRLKKSVAIHRFALVARRRCGTPDFLQPTAVLAAVKAKPSRARKGAALTATPLVGWRIYGSGWKDGLRWGHEQKDADSSKTKIRRLRRNQCAAALVICAANISAGDRKPNLLRGRQLRLWAMSFN